MNQRFEHFLQKKIEKKQKFSQLFKRQVKIDLLPIQQTVSHRLS